MFYLKGTMMFAFRVKAKLDRERRHRMEVLERLRSTQNKRDKSKRQLDEFDRPRCGMEKHGDFSKEKRLDLERAVLNCDYEISRDTAEYNESTKNCSALLRQLHRPVKGGQVKLAFLTPFF
jgi:hypothetical protein